MRTRQEIKGRARQAIKEQRATTILIIVLVGVVGFIGGALGAIPMIGWIISIAVSLSVLVLSVNVVGAFVKIYRGDKVELSEPFAQLQINFVRKLGGMCWMALFTCLWSMLFAVPGVIKGISYSMTPFILAECPNVNAKEALKISMRMTNGYKMELFVMYLSFIGWMMLSVLTLHILLIVFVGPYMETTMAGYYIELRDKALADGIIQAEELQVSLQ